MRNVFLEHYEKHKISPVKQDLKNIKKHFYIRTKLYEQLGVPSLMIKDKDVFEIGAGSGYNSIVTSSFKPKSYTIIEPNSTGREEMLKLFDRMGRGKDIVVVNKTIENFNTEQKFDIIFAEGFLPTLDNRYEILDKMSSLLRKNGIMVITTADDVSLCFDVARRFLANMLLKNKKNLDFDKQMEYLDKIFSFHLRTLKNMTRLTFDWCADMLGGDAIYQHNLSPDNAISHLQDSFYFYKISPDIILDETWYKDVPLSVRKYNNNKKERLNLNWHNLFHYRVFTEKRSIKINQELSDLCKHFTKLCKRSEYEKYNKKLKKEILETIDGISKNLNGISKKITKSLDELYNIIENDDFSPEKIKNMPNFKKAFGRGQQYMSFIKK